MVSNACFKTGFYQYSHTSRDQLVQNDIVVGANGQLLTSLIPGAELAVVRGGAHLFMVEQAGAFNRTVGDFLARVTDPEHILESRLATT